MLREFRAFVLRGNVLDLAVALIMGLAFSKIVASLVNDVVMPPIGLLLGKVNFADLFINLSGEQVESVAAAKAAGVPTINYGAFLNTIIEFIIVAFVLFVIVRAANRMTGLRLTGEAEIDDDLRDGMKEHMRGPRGS